MGNQQGLNKSTETNQRAEGDVHRQQQRGVIGTPMGIDLTLVPDKHNRGAGRDWILAYDRIGLHRDYDLFDAIREVETHPLDPDAHFDWYDDEGLERRHTDPYGEDLTWVYAKDLARVDVDEEGLTGWNQGILSFVRSVPPETRIVLWWH